MSFLITTTRFNEETWFENQEWRFTHDWYGCIYSAPTPVKNNLDPNTILFVLEMNNDENKLMGIGMTRNKLYFGKNKIYGDKYYCSYTYRSQYRVDRVDMTEREDNILKIMDILLFTGKGHLKRGRGFTKVPKSYIEAGKLNFIEHFREMFNKRYKNNKLSGNS